MCLLEPYRPRVSVAVGLPGAHAHRRTLQSRESFQWNGGVGIQGIKEGSEPGYLRPEVSKTLRRKMNKVYATRHIIHGCNRLVICVKG